MIQLPPGSRIINPAETKPAPATVPPPANYYIKPKEGAELPRVPGTPVEKTPVETRRIKVAVDPAAADTDKRVADLEKKLADMLRELEGLRKDLKTNPVKPPVRVLPPTPEANPTPGR